MTYCRAADVTVREENGQYFLVAARPLRALRVNRTLRDLVQAAGTPLQPRSPAHSQALEGLARRGFVRRLPPPATALAPPPQVSVVIPVLDRADELRRCLASLGQVRYPRDRLEVIVVDDGSRDDSASAAAALGARVIPSGGRGQGPAAARNRGAQAARGDLLAFIDSDCLASPGWLEHLVGRFTDPAVAAVGGGVRGLRASTGLDRYEATMSSLSLGQRERCAQGGADTFYLPSCNLLVRTAAFLAAGGFRPTMHVGEDVDLTWRLRDRGGKIVYAPAGWVRHEHRNRLRAFLKRRFEYGTSEAILYRLHPLRRKRIAVPPLLGAAAACALLGIVAQAAWLGCAALLLFGADTRRARARIRRQGLTLGRGEVAAARLRALGSLGYYTGHHLLRYYGPVLLLALVAWPVLAWLLVPGTAVLVWTERRVKGPSVRLPTFSFFLLAEYLAYATGVFWGCLCERGFGSYRPTLQRRMDMSYG